jgi:hypothetical protein
MSDLRFLLNPILEHAAFRGMLQALTEAAPGEGAQVTLSGLTSSAKGMVVAGVACQLARPVIVLTADNEAAANLQRTASTFAAWLDPGSRQSVLTFPSLDCSPYESRSPHGEILERRAVTLWSVTQGRVRVLLAPVTAALGRFRERAFYSSLALEIKAGDELALDDLAEHLSGVGYEREEPVSDVGQYAAGLWMFFRPRPSGRFASNSGVIGLSRCANLIRIRSVRASPCRVRCCFHFRRSRAPGGFLRSSSKRSTSGRIRVARRMPRRDS